ncbi:MAG: DUF4349 domain-containing protein [Alphaproteobacteria bacterium]|nr:DUF4349 domain-containing protein [Alphaproteobacteria bacterium]MBU1526141.1 DUF4349 domain-containing protein [Alphaproteobacteria bacterium]MBU2350222.1 DUF4349 domain-containing protein [Alphaproteobacteria bacterium]MBU2381408.1 DUF4349 domain-containing protein [Alphaproteobacteria bacterium]
MRKGLWLAAAGVLMLAGCEQAADDRAAETATEAAPAATADPGPAAEVAGGRVPLDVAPAPVARIAYGFAYALSVPRVRGAELMSRHELTCAAAGPGFCQVMSAQADWSSRRPGGRLELRGQPDWINRFRAGLAADARDSGGRLETAVTEGEDLTARIDAADQGVRTEADLAARIRDLQARRGGTLEQRLAVEKELADLRRRQDALALEARQLDTRVRTATLTIDYRQGGALAADSPTRPVVQAVQDAFGLSMGMLAVLITAGSILLPVVGVAGLTWWAIRRRRRPAAA